MLALLSRLLRSGLYLMSLRSLGLVAELQHCSRMHIRAARYTALAALSGTLAFLAGFGAILLSVSPNVRPLLLAATALFLALSGALLLRQARALKRNTGSLLITSLQSIQGDLATIRKMFDQDPGDCPRCGDRAKAAPGAQGSGSDPAQGRKRASCDG